MFGETVTLHRYTERGRQTASAFVRSCADPNSDARLKFAPVAISVYFFFRQRQRVAFQLRVTLARGGRQMYANAGSLAKQRNLRN